MTKRRVILYPLLLAVFPVLSLAAHNKQEVLLMGGSTVAWVAAAALALAGMAWALVHLCVRDWARAALVTALGVLLFFTFGHVRGGLESHLASGWVIGGVWIGLSKGLAIVWVLIFALGARLLFRLRASVDGMTGLLNVVSAVLVLLPAADLARYEWSRRGTPAQRTSAVTRSTTDAPVDAPDIFYIVLDAYARTDVLQRLYGHDNRPFIDALKARGFYVAEESLSNYAFTYLSLASSLNMQHVTNLTAEAGEASRDTAIPYAMIQRNKVAQYVKSKGYTYVHFSSGCLWTQENQDADVTIRSGRANEFLLVFAQTTMLGVIPLQKHLFREDARTRVLGAFDGLSRLNQIHGPKFVLAHIICPHPPFVFGPNGEQVNRADVQMSGGVWREKDLYVDQVRFVNGRVLALLDRLLSDKAHPPVIVLQGDHGPWFGFASKGTKIDWADPTVLWENMSILNACHLPARGQAMLYPTITPVNTFRVIFNACLGGEFPLLEDRSFYSDWQASPYRFVDVTDKVRSPESMSAGGRPAAAE